MKTLKLYFGISFYLISLLLFAKDLQLGEPDYKGSGCPKGSASVALSQDQTILSILFDEFIAEAGGNTGKQVDRKECKVIVPLNISKGFSISLFKIDYRGFSFIPIGGTGQFNSDYKFAGSKGPIAIKNFLTEGPNDYLYTNELKPNEMVWSGCGKATDLRINTVVKVKSNMEKESAIATVDSMDLSGGINYHIEWKQCQ